MGRDTDHAKKVLEDTFNVFGIGEKTFHKELREYLEQRIAQAIREEVRWSLHEKFTVLNNATKFACPKCSGVWALGDLYNPAGVALCPECNTLELAEGKGETHNPSTPFKATTINKATSYELNLIRGRIATLELRMQEVQKELEERRNAAIDGPCPLRSKPHGGSQ